MSDRLTRATQSLVTRFHRQRPVRSGSLLITVLGDSIAPRGGVVTLGSLIRLAEPLGLPDRHVRTSVGRLAQEGWLSSNREGRQSEYSLTEHGKSRFAEATSRIYREAPQSWGGNWTLVLLPPAASAAQKAAQKSARGEMLWLGFGQVRPGVLAHPNLSVAETRLQLDELQMDGNAMIMKAVTEGAEADRALVEAGWDLADISRRYRKFVESFEPVRDAVTAQVPPQTAFVIRTLLIHEYRKIHLRDPLLPHSLLPEDWIGAQAYELCGSLYRAVFSPADQFVSDVAETLSGKLTRPSRQTFRRFGGLDETSAG
jgi:phenylacetic acid degradation operon negative regulatory protein